MLDMFGVGIIFVGFLFAGYTTWRGQTNALGFFSIGAISVIAGIAIANLPRISSIAVQAGATSSLNVTLQELAKTAEEVEKDATEVRQIKEQIEVLVQRIGQGEQNVSQMYGAMQQTWRSLFESFAYLAGTSNITPLPKPLEAKIMAHLNILAAFAYPDFQERKKAMQHVMGNIQKAQEE